MMYRCMPYIDVDGIDENYIPCAYELVEAELSHFLACLTLLLRCKSRKDFA